MTVAGAGTPRRTTEPAALSGRSPVPVHARPRRSPVPRGAAAVTVLAGILNLLSALLPAERDRMRLLAQLVPGAVSRGATVVVAAAGVGLLLAGSAVLHVVKGLGVEEALTVAGATLAYGTLGLIANDRDVGADLGLVGMAAAAGPLDAPTPLRRVPDPDLVPFQPEVTPNWQPRYLAVEAPEDLLRVALATLRAEGLLSLPWRPSGQQPTRRRPG